MLARRRNAAAQRRVQAGAPAPATGAPLPGSGGSVSAATVAAVIEERLAAFGACALPSLVNENRLDDASGASMGETAGGAGSSALESPASPVSATPSGAGGAAPPARRISQAVLLVYLHIGSDPPDYPRVEPCAKLECWADPMVAHVAQYSGGSHRRSATSGSDSITDALEKQYRTVLREDVGVSTVVEAGIDVAKVALSRTRRAAREDRVLVHYNGHGMPRATELGEVWVFDKEKAHYVPLNILEVAELVGSPALYVLDCNAAGAVLQRWTRDRLPERRPHDYFMCACAANETLPLNPRLPADMLTACLTTPLRMALEWYIGFSAFRVLLPDVTEEMIRAMPGTPRSRHTPRGELSWILNAVTLTIAWCTLPAPQFHALFRQDAATRALFRNAILADRLMREAGCTPVTYPPLSETAHLHPMWELWEYTLERTVAQLPRLMRADATATTAAAMMTTTTTSAVGVAGLPAASPALLSGEEAGAAPTMSSSGLPASGAAAVESPPAPCRYEPSSFLDDQLTAFSVWVHAGDMSQLPEQLPCVLLALAQASHQVRAFALLSRYLDAGPTAGRRAILCGVLPYLSRLLTQAPRVFLMATVLWMQVIRADPAEGCGEVQRTQCEKYFTSLLKLDERMTAIEPVTYGQSAEADAAASGGGGASMGADGEAEPTPKAPPSHAPSPKDARNGLPRSRSLVNPYASASSRAVDGDGTTLTKPFAAAAPPGLYRASSPPPPPVFSTNSLDATAEAALEATLYGDGPQQPVQPTSRVPAPAGTIANHAVRPYDTVYYLMKDVDLARCKSMACYILYQFMLRGERQCLLCWNNRLVNAAFPNLSSANAELRSWSCLVLAKLFSGLRHAKSFASRECASRLDLFTQLLLDRSPIVRSSCVTLLASIVGTRVDMLPDDQQLRRLQMEKSLLIKLRGYVLDASMSVREELVFYASQVLHAYRGLLPPDQPQQLPEYVAAVGRTSPTWALAEAEVTVKSLLNTGRPTVNALFDDAVVFETTFLKSDDPPAAAREMEVGKLSAASLAMARGLLHDAALILCTLYRNGDGKNVNKALATLATGEVPQSRRFASEALRTMSSVASLDSAYSLSEADRTRMTWNADVMRQIVLDMRGRRLEPHRPRDPLPSEESGGSGGDTRPSRMRGSVSLSSSTLAGVAATATATATTTTTGGGGVEAGATAASSPVAPRHQVLPSAVPSDKVVCATFRTLEASMVLATKNQMVYYVSYDSYNVQRVVNSFPVELAGPIHDVLVINDLSEQSGLLMVTKRGGFSLMKGCWDRESVLTEAAVFSACPPPAANTWCDLRCAYRTSTATLFYGGPIGDGANAGGTEIHVLSLAEEQVTQRLGVSGNPTLTRLVAHTTQRALFAGFGDGVVRFYDDRQRQGQMGVVGMMECRAPCGPGLGSSTAATADAVVGLGLLVPDLSGDSGGAGAAPFTIAAATRHALHIFDARRLSEPTLTVSAAELYGGCGGEPVPYITNGSIGAHTGLIALSFSNGTYGAFNSKGLTLSEGPVAVSSYRSAQPPQAAPLAASCIAHPLRPLMSFAGDLLFLQV